MQSEQIIAAWMDPRPRSVLMYSTSTLPRCSLCQSARARPELIRMRRKKEKKTAKHCRISWNVSSKGLYNEANKLPASASAQFHSDLWNELDISINNTTSMQEAGAECFSGISLHLSSLPRFSFDLSSCLHNWQAYDDSSGPIRSQGSDLSVLKTRSASWTHWEWSVYSNRSIYRVSECNNWLLWRERN